MLLLCNLYLYLINDFFNQTREPRPATNEGTSMKRNILTAAFLVYIGAFTLLAAAQLNYNHAHKAAFYSDGTDATTSAIWEAHGFDPNELDEPTTGDKVAALVSVIGRNGR